jgi:hypothetical protein
MPAAGGGVAMDVNRYHALGVYILVLTGLRLVLYLLASVGVPH